MLEAEGSPREKDIWSGITTISVPPQTRDPRLAWDSHAINNWILLLALEGSGKVRLAGEECQVGKFDLVLIAPNAPHAYQSSHSWKLLWLHFPLSGDVLNTMVWEESLPHLRKMTLSPQVFLVVKFLLQEANTLNLSRQRNWFPLTMRLIEAAIFRADATATEQGEKLPEWVSLAMAQLNDLDAGPHIDRLARNFGLSRASFYTKFKKITGYSPGTYRELRRLRHAEQLLLQTNTGIAQIAYQCGYGNPLYFSSRFRKYYGVSPKTYRTKHFDMRTEFSTKKL